MLRRRLRHPAPDAARRRSVCRRALYAQLETGDRGILPLDSSGTLEIGGIHVDVGGHGRAVARAMPAGASPSARASGRCGRRCTMRRSTRRPTCPTGRSTRSSARSTSSARRSGPTATSPTSASCSTARAPRRSSASRAARSAFGADAADSGDGHRRAPRPASSCAMRWQRAWAQFRTSQSPIDYVRVSGMGADPLLVNAAQTDAPGPRLVAQPPRSLRRGRHPGRRSPAPARSIRAGRRGRGSSRGTARTMRSSAASR